MKCTQHGWFLDEVHEISIATETKRWGILGKDFHIPKWVFRRKKSLEAILRNRLLLQTDDTCIFNQFSHLLSHRAKIRTINWFSQIASRTMRRNFDCLIKNWFFIADFDWNWSVLTHFGSVHKNTCAFREEEGVSDLSRTLCKHVGICTVLNYEGGGGIKNLGKNAYVLCERSPRTIHFHFFGHFRREHSFITQDKNHTNYFFA